MPGRLVQTVHGRGGRNSGLVAHESGTSDHIGMVEVIKVSANTAAVVLPARLRLLP